MKIIRMTDRQWEVFYGGLMGLKMAGSKALGFYELPGVQEAVEAVRDAEDAPDDEGTEARDASE